MRLLILFLGLLMGGVSVAEESGDKGSVGDRLALLLLGKDGGDRFFYYPTKSSPFTPAKYGYAYEDVHFQSGDGTELHGWFLPGRGGVEAAEATVVFSHGNAGALGHHFGFVYWMVNAGYNVLMYDYRGYGKSGGEVGKKGMVEDAVAAFEYAAGREDLAGQALVSFGHSLGGAKSIAALSMLGADDLARVGAVVVDSTFCSYGDMGELMAGKTGRRMLSGGYEPEECVKKLAGVPLLVVHGTEDRTIPLSQARKLFDAAGEPKSFFVVEGGGHTSALSLRDGEFRRKVLAWLEEVLGEDG